MIMKMINKSILILIVFTAAAFAQQKAFVQKVAEEKIFSEESYPVDARPYLERFNKANGIDEAKLAKEQSLNKTNKTAWNFSVGSKGPYSSGWWVADIRTGVSPSFYIVPSTCRAVGVNCYIFVEDSSWVDVNNKVNQTVVDSIQLAFDSRTPANPNKGVYQTDVDAFGSTPNVDNDPKIIILLLNIRDGYKGNGGYVAGFFHSINEVNTTYSNMAEIYYLDCNPLPFLKQDGTINTSGLTTGMKTTAHEFQHMIHWNYIQNAETFFNEGWSLAAEVINGYSLYNQSYFVGESNHYLLDWRRDDNTAVLRDYSRAARFSLYLKEQFGSGIFKSYLNNRINGVTGLNIYLAGVGNRTFSSVLVDWWLANLLNENVGNTHPEWAYTYTPLAKVNSNVTYSNPNITNGTTSGLYKYSAEYLTFNSAKNLKINFNTAVNGYIKIKAIKVGTNTKVIENVTPGTDYSVPDLGTTYSSITFMVYHNNGNDGFTGPFVYSFNSSGTAVHTVQELAYVKTEPIGTGGGSDQDTTAIYFSGVQGAKLDSIKVALRQAGSLQGNVWFHTGVIRPTPIGKKIAGPFTASSNIATRPPSNPYPVPWPNWVKVDLRTLNIDASQAFVIGFINNGDYTGTNAGSNSVMLANNSTTHSSIYLHKPSSGSADWYTLVDANSNPTDFLVYAYISFGGPTGVNEPIELIPSSFSLEQNYPNPFNPSTVISYQLSVTSKVSLKVYDLLGREVATLVNEFQLPGNYRTTFSTLYSALPSGVYFYTLTAGDKIETKKMVLMK